MDFQHALDQILDAADASRSDLSVEEDILNQDIPSVDAVQRVAGALDIPAPLVVFMAIEEQDMRSEHKQFYRLVKRDFDRLILRFIREEYRR